jgi:hypothetical protein
LCCTFMYRLLALCNSQIDFKEFLHPHQSIE